MKRVCILSVVAVAGGLTISGAAQQAVFRAATGGVSVDVAVRDGNKPVLGLKSSDFIVYDGEKRQTIESVSIEAVPVDVTIFLGTNNETSTRQLGELNADIRKIPSLLQPNDRLRLLTLGNQVIDVFGWRVARDPQLPMKVEIGSIQSLYDACFVAMMHRPDPDRRHVIVAITDGVEFGSVLDSTMVRDVARRVEGVFHLVLVDPADPVDPPVPQASRPQPRGEAPACGTQPNSVASNPSQGTPLLVLRSTWFHVMADEHGLDRLEEAARLTGGTFRHRQSGESVVESFKQVFSDFRQSYLIRYTAEGVPPTGWHALRVEIATGKKYTVRARKGYFGG